MKLKDLIRQKRIERNLSTTQLAAMIGVNQSTIVRLEQGQIATLKQTKIVKLSEALGIPIPNIVNAQDDMILSPVEKRLIESFRILCKEYQDDILGQIEYLQYKQENAAKKDESLFG